MRIRKLHRTIGLVLLLPFLAWTFTGFVFFLKPGYAEAYELLRPKTYPLETAISVRADPSWLELKLVRTILGHHLLVRTSDGWRHLDPETLIPKSDPTEDDIRSLLTDAFSANSERYGRIVQVSNYSVNTDTGIRITLDWETLSIQQRGTDTDRIDLLYKIHYLQWTGISLIDRVLGVLALILVITLSVLGIRLAVRTDRT